MNITVTSDISLQANYLCYLAKGLSLQKYQQGGFHVLPYLYSHPKVVHFPNLNYSSKFWSLIQKSATRNFFSPFPQVCLDQVSLLLQNLTPVSLNIDYQKVINKHGLKDINLTILETQYGTAGSYFVKGNNFFISSRQGNTETEFEKTLLMAVQKFKNRDKVEIGEPSWHRRQAVAEYLVNLKIKKVTQKIIDDSQQYLQKLGLKPQLPSINFTPFTPQEAALLQAFLDQNGQIISFDKTAEIIWGPKSFDKFSPQAMAKVIENIRRKLRLQYLSRELIHTKRGFGYYFA